MGYLWPTSLSHGQQFDTCSCHLCCSHYVRDLYWLKPNFQVSLDVYSYYNIQVHLMWASVHGLVTVVLVMNSICLIQGIIHMFAARASKVKIYEHQLRNTEDVWFKNPILLRFHDDRFWKFLLGHLPERVLSQSVCKSIFGKPCANSNFSLMAKEKILLYCMCIHVIKTCIILRVGTSIVIKLIL